MSSWDQFCDVWATSISPRPFLEEIFCRCIVCATQDMWMKQLFEMKLNGLMDLHAGITTRLESSFYCASGTLNYMMTWYSTHRHIGMNQLYALFKPAIEYLHGHDEMFTDVLETQIWLEALLWPTNTLNAFASFLLHLNYSKSVACLCRFRKLKPVTLLLWARSGHIWPIYGKQLH